MSNLTRDELEYRTTQGVLRGSTTLTNIEERLRAAADEVGRYRTRFEKDASLSDKADNLKFALHHVTSNILGNLGLDILADAHAELKAVQLAGRALGDA